MISLSPLPSAHPSTFQRSRLTPATERPVQTRSRFGSVPQALILAAEDQLVGSLCKRHAVAPQRAPTACRRTVSGSISLPCSGCFSPFPHGTGPLSVFREYLALRVGPRGFGQDSSCPALLRWPPPHLSSPVRGCHPLRPAFPDRSGSSIDCFLSPPAGTEMFQFPAFAPAHRR